MEEFRSIPAELTKFDSRVRVLCTTSSDYDFPNYTFDSAESTRCQSDQLIVVSKLDSASPNTTENNEKFTGYHSYGAVPTFHLRRDGKYRAVCKIFVKCGKEEEYQGTGFLICDRIAVTVAHVTDEATQIFVHIGYQGENHVQPEVQIGEYIAFPWAFLTKRSGYDLAVIRLKEPFKLINSFIQLGNCTVSRNNPEIVVVGYPGWVSTDHNAHNNGGYMYESKGRGYVDFDEDSNTLIHQLNTEEGSSGGPVLELQEDDEFRAIGVHRGSCHTSNKNVATTFGDDGRRVEALIRGIEFIAAKDMEDFQL